MRLEDAALYLELDVPLTNPDAAAALAAAAIAGGADILETPGGDTIGRAVLEAIVAVCRRDDALVVVRDDCAFAAAGGADGVLLSRPDASPGQARAVLGMDALLGMRSHTVDEARLALEVGIDFLVHVGGGASPGVFAALPGAAGNILYAGGIEGPDVGAAVVSGGVYRLCVKASGVPDGALTPYVAAYSRLLGRCL